MNKKKIIITGGEGFVGANLVSFFRRMVDFDIHVIDNESAECNEQFYKFSNVTYHNFDINDLYNIDHRIFKDADAIFHLAAESRIGPAIANPIKAAETNIMGTMKILELSRHFNVKKFLYSSTSSIYGLRCAIPTTEYSPIDCLNPYSATKFAGEELVRMYSKMYGLDTCIFRYFNVFGPRSPVKGQYAPVVGIFLDQHRKGLPLTIVGNGEQRRDFVHVDDVVQANVAAFLYPENLKGEVFNIGSGKNYSVNEIASFISDNIVYIPAREGEAQDTLADNTKARMVLGCTSYIDIKDWIKNETSRVL